MNENGSLSARVASPRLAAAAAVGALAGFLSGLFGVGGGILIVPGLVLLMRMEQRLAHGTSLAAIVPIASSGVIGFAIHDKVDWPVAALIAAGASGGAVIGTRLLHRLDQRTLRLAFAVFLLLAAVRLLVSIPEAHGRADIDALIALALIALGLVTGGVAGLLGVGGGIVMIPAMVILFSIPDPVAKGTSLLVIIPTALVGTARNVRRANADLHVAAVVGLVGIGSAFGGSQIAVRLDARLSSVLFAVLLILVVARILTQDRGTRETRPGAAIDG